jgi:hypothetical protein
MNFFDFIKGLNWDFLKNIVLKAWVQPKDVEWVNFSDVNSINAFAEKVWPQLIKSNPIIAGMIKQNANMLWADKAKEVTEIIDMK